MVTGVKETTEAAEAAPAAQAARADGYVLPLVHQRVPERLVDLGFWGALGGSAALGLIDLPLAALLGAGVIVARHHAHR